MNGISVVKSFGPAFFSRHVRFHSSRFLKSCTDFPPITIMISQWKPMSCCYYCCCKAQQQWSPSPHSEQFVLWQPVSLFLRGLWHWLTSVCFLDNRKQFGIQTTWQSIVRKTNTKDDVQETRSCVYSIPRECGKKCIGNTRTACNTSITEHK